MFGLGNTNPKPFGGVGGGSSFSFGQQQPAQSSFGTGFGQASNPSAAKPGGFSFGGGMSGGFGSTNTASTGFGQQQTTQTSGFGSQPFGGGGFGSQPATSGFGSTNTGQTGFGGLGFQQQKPATGFGSTFGQQQQQQPGAGAATGFSSFGLGGTQQQQQQPGGAFGTTSMQPGQQQTTGSGFGGFGTKSAFGSTAPTSTFGTGFGTSTFGSQQPQAPGTSLGFGQQPQQQQQSGFGGFGQMSTMQQQQQGNVSAPPSRGFAFPKLLDKEGDTHATRLYYYDIHTHNRYNGTTPGSTMYSPDEVRWADMQAQGQAPAQTGGFGGFGSTTTPGTTGSFGSAFGAQTTTGTAPFGQQPQQQQQQQPGTAFGTLSGFNQQSKPGGFGGFGTTPSTGFGGFGSTTTATGGTQGTTGFGGFGQTQPGQQQAQPATTGFGSTFGSTTSTAPAFGTGSTFGSGFGATQTTTAQPQQPSGFSFNLGGTQSTATQPQTTGFGTTAAGTTGGFGTSAFGSTAAKPATTTPSLSFGGFGQTQQTGAQPSTTTGTAPTFGGFGSFGQPQQQQQQQQAQPGTTQPTGFSFGTQAQTGATQPTFGGFGTTQPAAGTGFRGFSQPTTTAGFGGFGTNLGAPATTTFGQQPVQQQQQQPQYNANYVSDPFKLDSLSAVPGSWLAPKPEDQQKTAEKIQEVAKKLHEGVAEREKATAYITTSAIGSDLDALSANTLATDVKNKDGLPSVPRLVSRTASIVSKDAARRTSSRDRTRSSDVSGRQKGQFKSSLQASSTTQNVLDSTSLDVTFLNQTHLPTQSTLDISASDATQHETASAKQKTLYELNVTGVIPKEPIDQHIDLTEVLLHPVVSKEQKSTVANRITNYTLKSALFQHVTALGNLLKRDGMEAQYQDRDKSTVSIIFSFPNNLEMLRLAQPERIRVAGEHPSLNLVTPDTVANSLSHQLVLAALNTFLSTTVSLDPHTVPLSKLKLLALTRRREQARILLEEFRKYLIQYQQMSLSQLDSTSMNASQNLINQLAPEHIFSILRDVCPLTRAELEVTHDRYSPEFALMPDFVSLLHNGCLLETDDISDSVSREEDITSLSDLGIGDKSTIVLAYAGPPSEVRDDDEEEYDHAQQTGGTPSSTPDTYESPESDHVSGDDTETSPEQVQVTYEALRREKTYLPVLPNLSDGYQVHPHPLILARMPVEELKKVLNFRIARTDFGTVEWLQPVDLVNVRLDQDVHIAEGLVEVYSSAEWEALGVEKPPVGSKLNRPARITMLYTREDIVALARQEAEDAGQSPDSIPDSLSIDECNQVLIKYCQEYDAQHLEWNPDTCEWTFTVAHF